MKLVLMGREESVPQAREIQWNPPWSLLGEVEVLGLLRAMGLPSTHQSFLRGPWSP